MGSSFKRTALPKTVTLVMQGLTNELSLNITSGGVPVSWLRSLCSWRVRLDCSIYHPHGALRGRAKSTFSSNTIKKQFAISERRKVE